MSTVSATLLGYAPGVVTGLCAWGFLHYRKNRWSMMRSEHHTKMQELVDQWTKSLEKPPIPISLDVDLLPKELTCPHEKGKRTICSANQQIEGCYTNLSKISEGFDQYKQDAKAYAGKEYILGLLIFAVGVAALSILFPPAGAILKDHAIRSTCSSLVGVGIALLLHDSKVSPGLAPGYRVLHDTKSE